MPSGSTNHKLAFKGDGTYVDDEDLMAGLTNTQQQTVKTLINTLREQNEEAVQIAEELKSGE